MPDEIVIVGSDGKQYPFPKDTDPKAIAGYFDKVNVKPVKLLQGSEAKQQQAPLAGSPLAPLKTPGAGFLQPGLGAVATAATAGGVSPAPTSPEQTLVEGAASVAGMFGAGVGTRVAENIAAKLLASGYAPKMANFMLKPLMRMTGAGIGGVTGSAVHSAGTASLGLEGAPKDVGEAAQRASEAGAANIALQGGFEMAVPLAKRAVGALWNQVQKAALGSKTAQNMRKLEDLKGQLTDEIKRVNIHEIKDAQAQQIQMVTGEIVNEMGLPRSPEQLKDLGRTIETRVNAALDRRMGPLHAELDRAASASNVTVDASPIGMLIAQAAAGEPRGAGIARPFTKPSGRFSEIVDAAKAGQPKERVRTILESRPGTPETRPVIDPVSGNVLKPGTPAVDPVVEAIRLVTDPGANKSIRLDAMLKARGTISREIANPATDDETRGLLQKILKPWDQTIKSGLTEINPGLAVKWDVAQDTWHKGKIIQDKVVMERLKSAGVRSLTEEIQPNAPRNVEQMRLLFNEAFPKDVANGMWRDLQRAKVEELIGTDLAGFGEKYRQYGNTMSRLFQTPEEKLVAKRLVTLSDDFAHLSRNPSIKNDIKINALQETIAGMESGVTTKNAVAKMLEFISRPHIAMYGTAAALGGHAYGGYGIAGGLAAMGAAEAIGQKAIPAIVRAAEHPAEANRLILSLNAFVKDANPNTGANFVRSLYAAYATGDAVARADAAKRQKEAPNAAETGP